MAFASLIVSVLIRPLRRSPKPRPGKMLMVFVPIELMSSKIFCCEPLPNATTDTTEAIPMIIPSMVSSERILCAIIACTDILNASIN
ncbi:Uncharacterised protein [Mycobacteroides abscessus subsp. massiliense]|nr:Uncharacterised protein [Mycobacteroides abscessus subsp. massiliense]